MQEDILDTGMTKRVDELGRIVIPKELRMSLGIECGDELEFLLDEENLILQKYVPGCVFCKNTEDLLRFHEQQVCRHCTQQLQQYIKY